MPLLDSLNVLGSHYALEKGYYVVEDSEASVELRQARDEQVKFVLHSKREANVDV